MVNGENGWLVPTRNVEALAKRMIWFIEHPEQWQSMANNSRRMVEDKFNVDHVNEAIGNIIGF